MAGAGQPSSRSTVLVVDDSRAVLDGLCNLLRADCNALFGFNGLEALALATSEGPDLIVLDVAMPGMDGYEVLRRLKENPATANIPVIFLTAPGPGVSEARALELGAIDFITKPYDPAILKARIHNQLAYKRSLDQAVALSLGDALTGIPNRRRFDEQLDQEWKRGLRSGKPLSMILMDIDHFKRFNDALGHPAGDACLQAVAGHLRQALKRSVDFVARYGGEEFACIVAETDLAGAEDIARRIAAAVARAAIAHPDSPVAPVVTLSMGVATLVPSPEADPLDLTREADARLYEAKRLGRNRIHAEPVPELTGEAVAVPPGILLVEDDGRQREAVLNRLFDFPTSVKMCPSVAEAMLLIQEAPPALILCSADLPGGHAHSLCRWVKEQPALRGIPFAFLAAPWSENSVESLAAGADDHLFRHEEEAVFRDRLRMLLELGARPEALQLKPAGADFLLLSPPGPMRSTMISLLSQEGIRTTFAADLEEALPALSNEVPDALILDLDLLDAAPAEALDRLRALPGCERLPILVLARKDQSLLVDALESRIEDRLEQPVDPTECRHRIRMLARCAHVRGRQDQTRSQTSTRPR